MKKTILSLCALFGFAVASAQSYPRQPDPTIVEVVPYQKPAEEVKADDANTSDVKNDEANKEGNETVTAEARTKEDNVSGDTKKALVNNEK